MKIIRYQEVESIESEKVGIREAEGLGLRPLIGKGDGALNFSMSVLDLEPGGHTPDHSHEREEQLFVISGSGELKTNEGSYNIGPGTAVFFSSNEPHQAINSGDVPLMVLVVTH